MIQDGNMIKKSFQTELFHWIQTEKPQLADPSISLGTWIPLL